MCYLIVNLGPYWVSYAIVAVWVEGVNLSRLKGLRHRNGADSEWIHPKFKLEKKEVEAIRKIADLRYADTRSGQPALGKAVACLVRTGIFCLRHHTEAYSEPRTWSDEEALEAGLRLPTKKVKVPVNFKAGPRRTWPPEEEGEPELDALD